jgi:hypothetical protein
MTLSPEFAARTDHGYGLYEGAFGELITGPQTIADIGAGDSGFAEEAMRHGKQVLRIDPLYAKHPPKGGDNYLAADARYMPEVPDESFETVLSSLMFQHVEHGNGDVTKIIQEMIRIAETTDERRGYKGFIAIFPVWRPEVLKEKLQQGNFGDVAAVGFLGGRGVDDADARSVGRLQRKNMPTLVIRKMTDLTQDRQAALATTIEHSRGLMKKQTLGDLARRAIISTTGENRISTRNKHI